MSNKFMAKTLKSKLSLISFTIGMVLLVLLVRKVGFEEVISNIKRLEYRVIYIFLLPITWYFIQSFAWWRVLTDDGVRVSLWHVFLTKITGEAINTVTPVSFVGGDPYRIYLLQKKVNATNSASSVVIDRTMYMLAVFLMLFTTFLLAWFFLPLPKLWRILFPVFTFLFFMAFVSVVFFQHKGMFGKISRLIQKIGIQRKRLEKISHKIEEVDEQVGSFYRKHKAHFLSIS